MAEGKDMGIFGSAQPGLSVALQESMHRGLWISVLPAALLLGLSCQLVGGQPRGHIQPLQGWH